jgi:hypothetical protein
MELIYITTLLFAGLAAIAFILGEPQEGSTTKKIEI